MALEVLSGAVYHDAAKSAQKVEHKGNDMNTQNTGAMNINITETTAAVKSSASNQSGKEQEKGQKDSSEKEQQIKNAISKANNKLKFHRTRFEFAYHEDTKRVSIKVYDKDTEEVIREIPTEEALEMIEKMWELAGLLVDERR